MHRFLFLLSCLCLSFSGNAQKLNVNWFQKSSSSRSQLYTNGMSSDKAGNIYLTGYFSDTVDFGSGKGSYRMIGEGSTNTFIIKMTPAGDIIWAKQLEGYSNDGSCIGIDSHGDIIVSGSFYNDIDCDPGPGNTIFTTKSGFFSTRNVFLLKLDNSGNLKWARHFKDSVGGFYSKTSFRLDSKDAIVMTGIAGGYPDMDPGPATHILNDCAHLAGRPFLVKIAPGGTFRWASLVGAPCSEGMDVQQIALDSYDNIHLTGSFTNRMDFDAGVDSFFLSPAGKEDIFLLQTDSSGRFRWAISAGSTGKDQAYSIAIDKAGNSYITGVYNEDVDFDPGPGTLILPDSSLWQDNIFIAKYDSSGFVRWAKTFSGLYARGGYGVDICCDSNCNVHTIGAFNGMIDLDPGPDTVWASNPAAGNALFISGLDSAGNYLWSRDILLLFGGGLVGEQILADAYSNIYTAGQWSSYVYFDPVDSRGVYTDAVNISSFLQKYSICQFSVDTTRVSSCESYSLQGKTYTSSGTFTQMIKTDRKCDQELTIHLTIDKITDTVFQLGSTLMAKENDAVYRWVTCPAFADVPGANARIFTATSNGKYALIVRKASCTDTSDCFTVEGLGGIPANTSLQARLQPNPASTFADIFFAVPAIQASVDILSPAGSVLVQKTGISGERCTLDLSGLATGFYLIRVTLSDGSVIFHKLVKQ
ncbi:MAG: T9SS type A sorting domain-containing protein [Chitinophagaceae bacterium]|nr:T9SS type A sorting domain-containing protein [Chitinophagaceae bacterium]